MSTVIGKIFQRGLRHRFTMRPRLAILFVLPLFFVSCLKEKDHDCPPEFNVTLGVKDKNYSNVNDVPELTAKSEQLPFRQYVSNLSYRLEDLDSKAVPLNVAGTVVENNNRLQTIELGGVPFGRYLLVVFGNTDRTATVADGISTYQLHPDNQEGLDTYILYDTLELSAGFAGKELNLERAKGGLYLQLEGLPDSVAKVEEQIWSVYRDVNQDKSYANETSIVKSFTDNLHPTGKFFTVLSPTVIGKESVLRLAMYKAGATEPFMFFPDIKMTIEKNKVTAFKINYLPEGGLEVWTSIAGNWVKLHNMDIVIN